MSVSGDAAVEEVGSVDDGGGVVGEGAEEVEGSGGAMLCVGKREMRWRSWLMLTIALLVDL